MAVTPARLHVEATRSDSRVTTLELFFDLVFVFALTQVTAALSDDLSWRGVARGVLVVALLWWSWVGYSWLGNLARADEGAMRLLLFAAMGAMFVLALAIPEAFEDLPGGLDGPVVVPVCYFVFRFLHLTAYWFVAAGDPVLRRQLLRFTPSVVGATTILLVAGAFDGAVQTWLWALALAVDYGGTYLAGASGWRLRAPGHFAERHGLIIIVALGESIVAIGVGVAERPISWPIVAASLLGLAVSATLWWAYFDVVALEAEHALAAQEGPGRTRMARDAYTYLHFPMVVGIVLMALGLKKVLEYVGDPEHHDLADPLASLALGALYGGVVLFLLGQVGFKARTVGKVNPVRIGAAVVLVALLPVAAQLPALVALLVLVVVCVAVVTVETVRFADVRAEVRREAH